MACRDRSRNRAVRWILVCAGLAALPGCNNPVPSPDEAAQAILNSSSFSTMRTVRITRIQRGDCPEAIQKDPEWRRWVSLGLASTSRVVTSAGITCRLQLSETVSREAQNWTHNVVDEPDDGDSALVVPVAVRGLSRVKEIRVVGATSAEAEFEWYWRTNLAGSRLGISSQTRTGVAQLMLADGIWRAVRLDVGSDDPAPLPPSSRP